MAEDESYPAEDDEEVTQVLTRLASTGTAACRLDEAFGGEALAAAMEQEPEPKNWMDHTEEGGTAPSVKMYLSPPCLLSAALCIAGAKSQPSLSLTGRQKAGVFA